MVTKRLVLASSAAFSAVGLYLFYVWRTRCRVNFSRARIIVIESTDDWNQHADILLSKCCSGVIGLDCEWVSEQTSGLRRKVAILQLAPSDDLCFVFRLSKLQGIPAEVEEILENPAIVKVGVAISDDSDKLAADYGIICNSCLDLRYAVVELSNRTGWKLDGNGAMSLQKITESILGVTLDKSTSLRCSNWEARELKPAELLYAASDALAAFVALKKIVALMTHPLRILLQTSWLYVMTIEVFENLFDVPFSHKFHAKRSSPNKPKFDKETGFKRRTRQPIRETVPYDNCVLQAPDGEVLAVVSRKKAEWYLTNEIATMVAEQPLSVRLKFEPKGRAILDKLYYTVEKKNRCVVCGNTEELLTKNVIPREYRSHFPEVMSSHNSHDVLLLCRDCHQRSNGADLHLRQQLATLCRAPISDVKYFVNAETKKLVSAAKALNGPHAVKIPQQRLDDLRSQIKQILNIDELTDDLIGEIASRDVKVFNENFISHGRTVVEHFANGVGLIELEMMWRQHFLDSMKPGYLPKMWSVRHNQKSMAYEIGTGRYNDVDRLLKTIGLSAQFVRQVVDEVHAIQRCSSSSSDSFEVLPLPDNL